MEHWDVVVVGGGPAGAACAAAARRADPAARVLVLDRADFPRDKVCGDGIAPEALDVLAGLGMDPEAVTAGYPEVPRLRRHVVRRVVVEPSHVEVDGTLTAGVLVGADGAESVVRRALAVRPNRPDQ